MATPQDKDIIYVDVDDEITTIIDKVRVSDGRVVALVLPKRASVFQSVVNMKLLKRSAEMAKKNVALITTESSLMPLAGSVGLHVAATPQSKPEIPSVGEGMSEVDEVVDEDAAEPIEGFTTDNAADKPVGELSNNFGVPMGASAIETLSLPDETSETPGEDADAPTKKPKLDKKLKVPNFNKFRTRLFLGGLVLVLLAVGLYVGLVVLPKATIAITTNSSDVNVNLTATLDSGATALDITKMVIPAKVEQQQKTDSQQVATTGKQNTGTKASGSVTMSATACAPSLGTPDPVPAGTGVSTSGLTFITQATTTFAFDHFSSGSCAVYKSGSTAIVAQNGGANYNVTNAPFTVSGRPTVAASGSTSGGTDNIIQVVAQADIDSAKQKLSGQDTSAIKSALAQALRQDDMYPLEATFATGTPNITTSNNVGDQANNVTVTQAVTYTMFGAKRSDLQALIKANVDGQINTSQEGISNDGLDSSVVSVQNATATTVQFSLQTTATVGPTINIADLKKQVAGQKSGAARQLIGNLSGVTKVDVTLSPFWVSAIPTDMHKITITIVKAK